MADIIPELYAQVAIPFAHASLAREAIITFGMRKADAYTATTANDIMTEWGDEWKATIDNQVTMGPVQLRVGTSTPGENLAVSGTTTVAGTASRPDSLSLPQAVLVHKLTLRGGRRGKGRFYVPWALADSDVGETGRLGVDAVSALQTRANAFLAGMESISGLGGLFLLHSESSDDTENPSAPGSPDEIVSLLVDPIVGVQRRRLGR
jgi:hypothetical protein